MEALFQIGDRVQLMSIDEDNWRMKELRGGEQGYIIYNKRNGSPDEVAVMFDEEFRGGMDFTPSRSNDSELISMGIVKDNDYITGRSLWVSAKRIRRVNSIEWIE